MRTLQPGPSMAGNDALACQRPRTFLKKRDKPAPPPPPQHEDETGRFVATFRGYSTTSTGKPRRKKSDCMHIWSDQGDSKAPTSHILTEDQRMKYMRKYKLSKKQIKEFSETFMVFDLDKSGSITVDDLGIVMAALQLHASPQELATLISKADKNNSGSMDMDNFLDLMCTRTRSDKEEELKDVFEMLDIDGDGFISVDELFESLSGLDEAISRYEVTCMIEAADADGDGRVDFSDFKSIMLAK